jgi:hypothetical protein
MPIDLASLSHRERDQLYRATGGPPRSLAEWAEHRRTWPGPYRVPLGPVTWLMAAQAKAIEDARVVARVAPWRYFTEVRE